MGKFIVFEIIDERPAIAGEYVWYRGTDNCALVLNACGEPGGPDGIPILARHEFDTGEELAHWLITTMGFIPIPETTLESAGPSRRERIATAAITGLCANPNRDTDFHTDALVAINEADALIAELDKEDAD